jgi:Transposase DDE domain
MPTRRGFLQGYNAHVAVTGDQLIIAVHVGQSTNDQACFLPMMQAAQDAAARIHAATGNADHVIGTVLADAGYNSDANLRAAGPDRLIALGKERDQARAWTDEPVDGPPPTDASPREVNRHRLRTADGRALYKRRAATVEPGIANLKKIIDRFLLPWLRQCNQRTPSGSNRVQPHEDPPSHCSGLTHRPESSFAPPPTDTATPNLALK